MSSVANPQPASPRSKAKAAKSGAATDAVRGSLHDHLRKAAGFIRVLDLLTQSFGWLAAILAIWLVACLVDHWLVPMGYGLRWLFWCGVLGGTGWWLAKFVRPLLLGRINHVYAAKRIEHLVPEFKNGLISWLELERLPEQKVPRGVMAALAYRAKHFIGGHDPSTTVDTSPLIKLVSVVLLLSTLMVVYIVVTPKSVVTTGKRILMPWASIAIPARVEILAVDPGSLEITRGSQLKVDVELRGLRDSEPVNVRFSSADRQIVDQSLVLEPITDGLHYEGLVTTDGQGVQQAIEYWVEAGDAVAGPFQVTLSPLPAIVIDQIELRYPEYTKLPPRVVTNAEPDAVEGTVARITAHANQPIERASLQVNPTFDANNQFVGADADQTMQVDNTTLSGELLMQLNENKDNPTPIEFRIRGTNAKGLSNPNPVIQRLSTFADVGPEVTVFGPPSRVLRLPASARPVIEIRAHDPDYGLAEIRMQVRLNSRVVGESTLLKSEGTLGQQVHPIRLNLADLSPKPGDQIQVLAAARDNRHDPVTRKWSPNAALSEPLLIEIVGSDNEDPQNPEDVPPESTSPEQLIEQLSQDGQSNESASSDQGSQDSGDSTGTQDGNNAQENQSGNAGDGQQGSNAADESGSAGNNAESQGSGQGQASESDQDSPNTGNAQSSRAQSGGSQSDGSQSGEPQDGSSGSQSATNQQGTSGDAGSSGQRDRASQSGNNPSSDRTSEGASPSNGNTGSQPMSDGEVIERVADRIRDRSPQPESSGDGSGQQQGAQDGSGQQQGAQDGSGQQQGAQDGSGQQQGAQDGSGQQQGAQDGSGQQQGAQDGSGQQQGAQDGSGQQQGAQDGSGQQQGAQDGSGQQQGAQDGSGQQQGAQDGSGQQQGAQDGSGQQQGAQDGSGQQQGAQDGSGQQQGAQDGSGQQQGAQDGSGQQQGAQDGSGQQQGAQDGSGQQQGAQDGSGQQQGGQSPGQQGGQSEGNSENGNSENADGTSDDGESAGEGGSGGTARQPQTQGSGQSTAPPGQSDPTSGGSQQSGASQGGASNSGAPSNGGQSGQAQGGPAGNSGRSTGGGSSQTGGGPGGSVPDAEDANAQYAERTTEMVLDYLNRQKDQPDPELLRDLDWSQRDLQDFVDRWNAARDLGTNGTETERLEWKDKLNQLGLSPTRSRAQGVSEFNDSFQRMLDSGVRIAPPEKSQRLFEAFQRASRRGSSSNE